MLHCGVATAAARQCLALASRHAKALSPYDLVWCEEPGDLLDFELQVTLRNYDKNPLATGEDLISLRDLRNLIRYGGMCPDSDLPGIGFEGKADLYAQMQALPARPSAGKARDKATGQLRTALCPARCPGTSPSRP